MKKSYFITGTSTGVGKTFVACALARLFKNKGLKVGVMKPIETGAINEMPADSIALKEASGCLSPLDIINPYRFAPALTPSVAARLTGVKIDLKKIKKSFDMLSKNHDIMLVEGAGGLLTPISGNKTIADIILLLDLKAIVVSASRLGCINSTLLTLKYAENIGLDVKGVILNHPSSIDDESAAYNKKELEGFGVKIAGDVPFSKEGAGMEDFLDMEPLVEF